MSAAEVLVWVLRGFGALYVIGGVIAARQAWFWTQIGPSMKKLGQALDEFSNELGVANPPAQCLARDDTGRPWWLFVGGILTIVAGAAMLLAHRLAVPLLALMIVHQLLYLARQRRRERHAATPEEAADARPEQSTINAFFVLLAMAVLAAWLYRQGVLA